jgi:hypothetical protein
MEGYRENDPHFATKALHVGQEPEQWNRSLTLSYLHVLSTCYYMVIFIHLIVFLFEKSLSRTTCFSLLLFR